MSDRQSTSTLRTRKFSDFTFFLNYPHVTHRIKTAKLRSKDFQVFRVVLFVKQFLWEDVFVSIRDGQLEIRAAHQEYVDQHGFVAREFSRLYPIPEDFDPQSISAVLTPNGYLSVRLMKKRLWTALKADNEFRSHVDLDGLKFEKISIEAINRSIYVDGIPRSFDPMGTANFCEREVRTYYLPNGIDPESIQMYLNSDRMLEVQASMLDPSAVVELIGKPELPVTPEDKES